MFFKTATEMLGKISTQLEHTHNENTCTMPKQTSSNFDTGSLTCKALNTTIAEFENTVDPDETAHNEPSHLDLQFLPSSF